MNKSLVDIINNCEKDFGIELDPDFDIDSVNELCYNDYCNENCGCVDSLYKAIGEQLELQIRAEENPSTQDCVEVAQKELGDIDN